MTTITSDLHCGPLTRRAGPIALVAGVFVVATDLVRLVCSDRSNLVATMSDPVFLVGNAGYFFALCALAVALVAVYGLQATKSGWLRAVGFGAALVGTMNMAGNMWFEGFAVPWLAEVLPAVFTAEKTTILQVGGLSSYLLFALGWVLYGLASIRARAYPILLCLSLIVSGVLGFRAGGPPYGVPIGLTFIALGWWLLRARPEQRAAAEPTPMGN